MTPSLNSISRALRDQGVRFRETDLRGWLRPFASRDSSEHLQPETRTQKSRTPDAIDKTTDATGTRLTREKEVSLFSNTSSSSSPSGTTTPRAVSRESSRAQTPREPWVTPPVPAAVPDDLPDDPEVIVTLAEVFMAVFVVDSPKPKVRSRYLPLVAQVLTRARSRGNTGPEAWEAFGKARTVNLGAPVFRPFAALDHLPPPRWAKSEPREEHNPSDDLPTRLDLIAAGRLPSDSESSETLAFAARGPS